MAEPRVVIAEDEPAVRFVLRELLGEEGFAVEAVAGGQEALGLLAAGAPVDAILIDLFTPGMRGRDLVHAIRADGHRAHVPILLLTGAVCRAEDHPAPHEYQCVIQKPFAIETLVGALHEVMGAARQGRA